MPQSLCDVPDEILVSIFGGLDEQQDKSTMTALRLTSKHILRFVDVRLYCTVRDTIRQNDAHDGQLQSRTWDVVRDLTLARHIKAITLRGYDFMGQHNQGRYKPPKAGSPSKEQFRHALDETCLPEDAKDKLCIQLLEAAPAANLALLIALCTNIKELVIPLGFEALSRDVQKVISSATRQAWPLRSIAESPVQTPILSSLTHLKLGSSNYRTGLAEILPLLRLPSLRSLDIDNLVDTVREKGSVPEPLASSSLARPQAAEPIHFQFDSCCLSAAGLSCLLQSCRSRPVTLTIRWGSPISAPGLTSTDIGHCLREHGNHVTALTIDTTTREYWAGTIAPDSFGSLSSLRSLTTLAVPYYAFAHTFRDEGHTRLTPGDQYRDFSHMLPPSLRRLYILGVVEREMPQDVIDQVLNNPALPDLKTVVQVPWHTYTVEEWYGSARYKCIDYRWLRKKHGVDLGLQNTSSG